MSLRGFGLPETELDPLSRLSGLPSGLDFAQRHIPWARHVPLDIHLANPATQSGFLVLGEDAAGPFFAEERALLTEAFPAGTVEERYVVSLAVARL